MWNEETVVFRITKAKIILKNNEREQMKRLICLLMALVIVLAAVTGCTSNNEESSADVSETAETTSQETSVNSSEENVASNEGDSGTNSEDKTEESLMPETETSEETSQAEDATESSAESDTSIISMNVSETGEFSAFGMSFKLPVGTTEFEQEGGLFSYTSPDYKITFSMTQEAGDIPRLAIAGNEETDLTIGGHKALKSISATAPETVGTHVYIENEEGYISILLLVLGDENMDEAREMLDDLLESIQFEDSEGVADENEEVDSSLTTNSARMFSHCGVSYSLAPADVSVTETGLDDSDTEGYSYSFEWEQTDYHKMVYVAIYFYSNATLSYEEAFSTAGDDTFETMELDGKTTYKITGDNYIWLLIVDDANTQVIQVLFLSLSGNLAVCSEAYNIFTETFTIDGSTNYSYVDDGWEFTFTRFGYTYGWNSVVIEQADEDAYNYTFLDDFSACGIQVFGNTPAYLITEEIIESLDGIVSAEKIEVDGLIVFRGVMDDGMVAFFIGSEDDNETVIVVFEKDGVHCDEFLASVHKA